MIKVKVAGVPEHFNYPWHMAIADNAFAQRGIDLQWIDVPEGTGRMAGMLQENEVQLAIILTEGVVKAIIDGNPARIVQTYVDSPLLWGIHCAANSSYEKLDDIQDKKAAISRYGSGSHLMSYVNAARLQWDITALQFEVVNNLEGAVNALTNGEADYFMWEHFTTKPLVDKGIFRHLGDCPTPWPCFVIAASGEFLKTNKKLIPHILDVINTYTAEFKEIPSIDRTLSNVYEQELGAIQQWLRKTSWAQQNIKDSVLDKVQEHLFSLDLIQKKVDCKALIN